MGAGLATAGPTQRVPETQAIRAGSHGTQCQALVSLVARLAHWTLDWEVSTGLTGWQQGHAKGKLINRGRVPISHMIGQDMVIAQQLEKRRECEFWGSRNLISKCSCQHNNTALNTGLEGDFILCL